MRSRYYGPSLARIRRQEFDHGATRKLGISLTRGEYALLTVGDAVPLDERWMAPMVENLERDERVAGVYDCQIPYPDSSPPTRVVVNSLALAGLERREQFTSDPEQYRKMPPRKRRLAAFDVVSSCRSVWEEVPFEKTNSGEDLRWGKRVVEAGYKIVYEPRSAVFHSHERGAMYNLRRHYVDQRLLLELFGLELVPNLAYLSLTISRSSLRFYRLLRRDEEGAAEGVTWGASSAASYAVLAQVGSYLGSKAN